MTLVIAFLLLLLHCCITATTLFTVFTVMTTMHMSSSHAYGVGVSSTAYRDPIMGGDAILASPTRPPLQPSAAGPTTPPQQHTCYRSGNGNDSVGPCIACIVIATVKATMAAQSAAASAAIHVPLSSISQPVVHTTTGVAATIPTSTRARSAAVSVASPITRSPAPWSNTSTGSSSSNSMMGEDSDSVDRDLTDLLFAGHDTLQLDLSINDHHPHHDDSLLSPFSLADIVNESTPMILQGSTNDGAASVPSSPSSPVPSISCAFIGNQRAANGQLVTCPGIPQPGALLCSAHQPRTRPIKSVKSATATMTSVAQSVSPRCTLQIGMPY